MLPPKNSTVTLRLKRHPFPNLCNIVTLLSVGGLGQCLSPCSSFPSVPHQSDSNNNKWHNTTICWCFFLMLLLLLSQLLLLLVLLLFLLLCLLFYDCFGTKCVTVNLVLHWRHYQPLTVSFYSRIIQKQQLLNGCFDGKLITRDVEGVRRPSTIHPFCRSKMGRQIGAIQRKVIDNQCKELASPHSFHPYGQEVLWNYDRSCM